MNFGSGRVKDSQQSWLFLATTGLVVCYVGGVFDSFGVLLVIFVEYFEESNAKIGWIGSFSYSLLCFSYPFGVLLCRRFGFRRVLMISAILVSTSFLTTPLVPSANYLFLTYCVPLSVGAGIVDCLSVTILSEYFKRFLGMATGIRLANVAIGSMTFSYLYPIIIDSIGWRKTFYCFSSTGVVILFLAFCYRKPSNSADCEVKVVINSDIKLENEEDRPIEKWQGFLRDRGFQLIVIGCVPFLVVVGVPMMFMVQYAKSLGYPLSQAKWLAVVRSMASLIGRATMGFIGDFAFRRGIIAHIASTVVTVFGLASGLCTLTQYLPLMILYMVFIGLLEGMFWVIIPLMMNQLTGGINADYAFSLMTVITAVGYLTGPSSMGWLYDATKDFRNVLYVICVCCLVSGAIIALGIYVKSHRASNLSYDSEQQQTKCDRGLTKYNENLNLIILARRKQEIMPEYGKKTISLYETAV